MRFLSKIAGKFKIIGEVVSFLWKRKLWWMIPMILILLLIGLLLILAGSSPLGPFIYTVF